LRTHVAPFFLYAGRFNYPYSSPKFGGTEGLFHRSAKDPAKGIGFRESMLSATR
jgi:hypothetical protein